MKLKLLKVFLFFVSFCVYTNAVLAVRTARILYFNAAEGAPEKMMIYQNGKEPLEAELPRNNFSQKIELIDGPLKLYFLPDIMPAGVDFPVDAPSLQVSETWDKVLILAFADPENPIFPVRFRAINARDDSFGDGDYLFLNFSKMAIGGYFGSDKFILPSKESKVVSAPVSEKGDFKVRLDAIDKQSMKRQRFMRKTWRYDPSCRNVVLVIPLDPPRNLTYYVAPVRDM